MKIAIINNETKHLGELKKLFEPHQIHIFNYNKIYNISEFDLVILSGGSHHSIFDIPNPYTKELELIKNSNKAIIGICLGCQLIAEAFNSFFGELSNKIRKIITIKDIKTNKEFFVYEAHRYYIKGLGKQLIGIAQSSSGREIIKHKRKPIFGLQFHPEVRIKNNDGLKILNDILSNIKTI